MDQQQQDALWGPQRTGEGEGERPLTTDDSRPTADLDHSWIVESLDRQLSFESDGSSLWLARAHCTLCGLRVTFQSAAVPPCQPPPAPRP